jgi:hypothetical protein
LLLLLLLLLLLPPQGPVRCLDAAGPWVVSGGQDDQLHIYDVKVRQKLSPAQEIYRNSNRTHQILQAVEKCTLVCGMLCVVGSLNADVCEQLLMSGRHLMPVITQVWCWLHS